MKLALGPLPGAFDTVDNLIGLPGRGGMGHVGCPEGVVDTVVHLVRPQVEQEDVALQRGPPVRGVLERVGRVDDDADTVRQLTLDTDLMLRGQDDRLTVDTVGLEREVRQALDGPQVSVKRLQAFV